MSVLLCYYSAMRKTERLVAITLLLQARGKMTGERLAAIMDVSTRTIYRDMDALSLAHVPVTMDYGPGGGYYLPEGYRLDPTIFTSEEAVALALGGSVASGYRLFESEDGLRRALVKLEAALPEEYRADVRTARERILFDTTAWYRRPTTTAHLETVRAALWGARQLDLLYSRSSGAGGVGGDALAGDPARRRVEPHGLVCKAGAWYLVGYCHVRRDFRTFRVDRIEDLTVREEAVRPRPGFDLQTYWEQARRRFEEQTKPFALTLRVSASGRSLVAEATVLREEDCGGAVVRVDVESAAEAAAYALARGAVVTVLSPPEVRDRVAAAARAVAELYNRPRSIAGVDG